MTADEYLLQLVQQISAPTGVVGPGERVRSTMHPLLARWAGTQLASVALSGSYAKGTAVRGGTDVDLFVSLKPDTTNTLKEIYDNLALFMTNNGYVVRRQNVSIGVTISNLKVDLVPGKLQNSWGNDHSIYVARQQTWQKTNIQTHISYVGQSGRTREIMLTKRWRAVHGLEFQSFAAELSVLTALSGTRTLGLASSFMTVLEFLRDRLPMAVLQDPANTNNNVADELTAVEKRAVAAQATSSITATKWEQIIW